MGNDEIDLLDVYRALREDWGWITGITGAFAAASVIAALIMTEIYRAEVIVTEAQDNRSGGSAALARQFGGLAGLAGIDLGGLSNDGNQIATPYLQSRALVAEFVERNDLVPVLSAHWDRSEPLTLWMATRMFIEKVRRVTIDQRTGLITVSVEWTEPTVAAEWANGLVALANQKLRERALAEAEHNIAYLHEQIERTSVVGIQQVMFNLIESEMQNAMFAKARPEYAFAVIDPAVPPEQRVRPRRAQIAVMGTFLGGLVALLFVGFRRLYGTLKAREAAERR